MRYLSILKLVFSLLKSAKLNKHPCYRYFKNYNTFCDYFPVLRKILLRYIPIMSKSDKLKVAFLLSKLNNSISR